MPQPPTSLTASLCAGVCALLLTALPMQPAAAGDHDKPVTTPGTPNAAASGANPSTAQRAQRRGPADRVDPASKPPSASPSHARRGSSAAEALPGKPIELAPGLVDQALWLDQSRVAEFGAANSPGAPTLVDSPRTIFTPQVIEKSLAAPAHGKTAGPTDNADGTGRADDAGSQGRSPVFIDASGRARALPGGVIVTLKAGLADAAAEAAELTAAGLQPLRRITDRHWLVASEPGLASLALANQLQQSGRFERVQPNWWVARQRK